MVEAPLCRRQNALIHSQICFDRMGAFDKFSSFGRIESITYLGVPLTNIVTIIFDFLLSDSDSAHLHHPYSFNFQLSDSVRK